MSGRVVVTGGSGFTGGYVLRELAARGYDVVTLTRSPDAASKVRALGSDVISGDLDDPESVRRAFASAGADTLVNVASLGFGHAGTIVDAAEAAGIERAVFVSTTSIFTALPAPSKAVRVAAEERVMQSRLDWRIVRPTMIYGAPGDRNMERLLRLLRRTPVVPVPARTNTLQQPVHVEDLAKSIVEAAERPGASRQAVNVAGPEPLTFGEVLDAAMAAVGRRPVRLPVPVGALRTCLRGYERVSRRPRLKVEQLDRLTEDKAFPIEDAVRLLGHAPRPFAVGIAEEAAACRPG